MAEIGKLLHLAKADNTVEDIMVYDDIDDCNDGTDIIPKLLRLLYSRQEQLKEDELVGRIISEITS